MTEAQRETLARLRAITEAASPGPWRSRSALELDRSEIRDTIENASGHTVAETAFWPFKESDDAPERNADFIAYARMAVPTLIKIVEAQDDVISALSAALVKALCVP